MGDEEANPSGEAIEKPKFLMRAKLHALQTTINSLNLIKTSRASTHQILRGVQQPLRTENYWQTTIGSWLGKTRSH